ncbi:MAG: TrkA C-terminal domain-containing protein [Planctomycetota bacterium]|nr:TrkA C-terminal domain-containing protein [Planctomycetota bacterium]
MFEWVRALNEVPLAGLMLIVAIGYMVGRLAWRGMSIGPAGGTLALAILLGHWGLDFEQLYGTATPGLTVGDLGFAFFIYSVGFEAGPQFFTALMGGPGWRFVVVGTVVNLFALGFALLAGLAFGLGDSITAGLLSGALTSAPTYAAAEEVCSDPAALSVTFALTYPIGLVGVVWLVQALPRLMGDNLAAEADAREDRGKKRRTEPELTRAFDVSNEAVIGKSLKELDLTHGTGCYITLVHRGSAVFRADADTVLEAGDHVMAKGRFDELRAFGKMVGEEVYDEEMRNRMPAPRRIHVDERGVIGKSLRELDFASRYHCLVTAIERGQVTIEPSAETRLERHDVVHVIGRRGDMRELAVEVGRWVHPAHETDIAVYAGGVFLGLLLGRLAFGGFGLGTAGGLLVAGILLGRFRHIGPFSTHVPPAARQLVRDLGILLFVAETGVQAGGQLAGTVEGVIGPTLLAAAGVTVFSVLGAALVARWLIGLSAVDTWGSIGGGMTSSAALVAVKRAAESNAPALAYAAAYAVASVLVTIAGQLVVYLAAA